MPDRPLDYSSDHSQKPPQTSRMVRVTAVVLATLGSLWIAGLFWGGHRRESRIMNEMACAAQLRSMGEALRKYGQAYGGNFPPDLTTLAREGLFAPVFLVCPSSDDTPASSPDEVAQPGHCSYVYVGAGLQDTCDPASVLAFDDPGTHEHGVMVLYANGHVDYTDVPAVLAIMKDLASGRNPPGPKMTMTRDQAEKEYTTNWKARMPGMKATGWKIPQAATQQTTASDE